jgi:hypothetical protein
VIENNVSREQPAKRRFKGLGYLNVFIAWLGFTGRVVVDEDYFTRIERGLFFHLANKIFPGKIVGDYFTAVGCITGDGSVVSYYPHLSTRRYRTVSNRLSR